MGTEDKYDGIDAYAATLIKYKARQLVGNYGFVEEDIPDIEQELALDLTRRLPKFNPRKAKKNTFVARIIDNKVATLVEARSAAKRDWRVPVLSLDQTIESDEEEIGNLHDLLSKDETPQALEDAVGLGLDLEGAIESLPPKLRDLCRSLCERSVTEVSRDTGIPRSTLYDYLKVIRRRFEEHDLQRYLD